MSKFEPVFRLKEEINQEISKIGKIRTRNRSKMERSRVKKSSKSRQSQRKMGSLEFDLPFSPDKKNFHSSTRDLFLGLKSTRKNLF